MEKKDPSPKSKIDFADSKNQGFFSELLGFLLHKKAWWMTPIIIMFLLAAILIVFGHSTAAVSPFIYPLF